MNSIFLAKKYIFRVDIIGPLLCVLFFLYFPQLDLSVTEMFFTPNKGFEWGNNPFIQLVYNVFAKIHFLYLIIFAGGIYYCSRTNKTELKHSFRFLLFSLLIGPGLLVNIILKDNSVGRPRPQHTTHFSGDMTYTPVFHYSGECTKNCSFVSGHASIGFFLFAMAWVRRNRMWFVYGTLLGLGVGFTRIIQGGHFLSDVIFAGWVTYGICFLFAHYMKLGFDQQPSEKS